MQRRLLVGGGGGVGPGGGEWSKTCKQHMRLKGLRTHPKAK